MWEQTGTHKTKKPWLLLVFLCLSLSLSPQTSLFILFNYLYWKKLKSHVTRVWDKVIKKYMIPRANLIVRVGFCSNETQMKVRAAIGIIYSFIILSGVHRGNWVFPNNFFHEKNKNNNDNINIECLKFFKCSHASVFLSVFSLTHVKISANKKQK